MGPHVRQSLTQHSQPCHVNTVQSGGEASPVVQLGTKLDCVAQAWLCFMVGIIPPERECLCSSVLGLITSVGY